MRTITLCQVVAGGLHSLFSRCSRGSIGYMKGLLDGSDLSRTFEI